MKYWNYRILKHKDSGFTYHSVVEVYFDKGGEAKAWCEAGLTYFESLDDLKSTVDKVNEAMAKSVLTYPDDFVLEDKK